MILEVIALSFTKKVYLTSLGSFLLNMRVAISLEEEDRQKLEPYSITNIFRASVTSLTRETSSLQITNL